MADFTSTSRGRAQVSDEELARVINEDQRRNPDAYAPHPMYTDDIPSSKYFVHHFSARGIAPLRKWL